MSSAEPGADPPGEGPEQTVDCEAAPGPNAGDDCEAVRAKTTINTEVIGP